MMDLSLIPENPGSYLFKDKEGKVIYVGKAKNLRKRVKSYFRKKGLDAKTQVLVENIDSVDFVVTDNEVEAYVLEDTLIKKHQPKFNIDLRDSRRYAYIRITDEEFPRLVVARNKSEGGQYFGPFVSAERRDYLLKFLRKTFRIRTCKKLPTKPCLRYHISRCQAPCRGTISAAEYRRTFDRVRKILGGNIDEAKAQIYEEMGEMARQQNFERALELKNQLDSLEKLKERQNMDRQKDYDEDVLNYVIDGGRVTLFLFNACLGTVDHKEEFSFDYRENFLEEFLVQYYSEIRIPSFVIVPDEVSSALSDYLTEKAGKKVKVVVPKKGERFELLELVRKNIEIMLYGNAKKVEALQKKLGLSKLPKVIECFDISHLSGTSMVGSMVQFRSGIPDKGNYRRFRIRDVSGIDDFRAIAEVVRRRYSRLIKEGRELPDLVVIDGGREQLNFALSEIKKLGLDLPVISIAKREEEIYLPGRAAPVALDHKETALKFVQEIRDEAHRFAIKYQRLLRSRSMKD
ncbi:MAG: excinuclease ABC subunit C [Candidatus Aenigmarchaeota archaeon]|nr:excinuclease ABC subunit C [Candidatus Aenigmarchaeota archaeon]